jgi:Mce-associated membrane protein
VPTTFGGPPMPFEPPNQPQLTGDTTMLDRSTTKDVFDRLMEQNDLSDNDIPDSTTDDIDTGDVTEPDDIPELSRGKRLLRIALAALGALVFVAAVGLAAFFGWQLKQRNDIDAASRTSLEVAQNYAVTLSTVDNANIDQNFNQVIDGATGEFKDMYTKSAAQLRQLLIDNKAVSHGTVVDSAIKSATKDRVDVLIFVDQSISNSVNPQPRIDRSRVAITMEHIGNRWLASKVDIK